MSRNWIAVACAEHVRRGRELGIMQVCHGKAEPLRRIQAGDRVACYSPALTLSGRERCQAFTAFGTVRDERVYQVAPGEGFHPHRRDVDWHAAVAVSIHDLREDLALTRGRRNWGYVFRYGLVAVSDGDMDLIASRMGAASPLRRAG